MPIHGMFLFGIREIAPTMSVKMHCFVFYLIKYVECCYMRLGLHVYFQHQDVLSNGENFIFHLKTGLPTNV